MEFKKKKDLTSSSISLGSSLGSALGNVFHVNGHTSLGEVPHKILDLVLAVLVLQELNELGNPFFGVEGECPSRVAEGRVVWIQDGGGEEGPQVGDGLVVGWQVSLGKGT